MPVVRISPSDQVQSGFYQRLRPSAATASEGVVMRQFIWFGVYDDYEFPFAPRDITYQELATEVAEVARAGTYAYVEERAPRLMKVSFDVRIADRLSGGLNPIDDQLSKLRNMALTNSAFTFIGLDRLISVRGQHISAINRIEQAWFKWTGFSIQSVRRVIIPDVGHAISIADCSFEFVEYRNQNTIAIPLPRLLYPPEVPEVAGTGGQIPTMSVVGSSRRTISALVRDLQGGRTGSVT